MGKNPKKTTTKDSTQNTKYDATTTASQTGHQSVDVPEWLLNPAQKQASTISGLMDQGPAQFTPQMGALSQQAITGAAGLNTTGSGYGAARDAISSVSDVGDTRAHSVLEGLSDYENPYRDAVLDPVLNDYDVNAGKTRAMQAAQGAGGAFRGSRFGVREGATEGELARGRAATEGGLLDRMYTQGASMAEADTGRRQGTDQFNVGTQLQNQQNRLAKGGALAGLEGQTQADIRANLGMQSTLGGQQTDFENAQRQYPLEFANQTGALLQGMNPQAYFGQSSEGTSLSNTTGTQDTTGHEKSVEKTNPGLLAKIGSVMDLAKSGIGLMSGMGGIPGFSGAFNLGSMPSQFEY